MNFKGFLRVVVFLAIVFVIIYVGVNNVQTINFSFPLALQKDVRAPACFILFGAFAVGVLGGWILHVGGGGGGGGRSRSSGKDK